ncbi:MULTISPECIES: 3-deoxy-7-phosphoheptulonate synthase [Prauserella salsuginis group]|uniref:Phospho-2-dehydro-3-deoxyheptonate aldolase n=2 Tax=Prauserella salsuginis group TaxID=2893672 RepID=A0A839XVE8_9PSEU|nr:MULTISPECIES: 3-deoxy-7-phosphoheptulonate synthase [Prauserella salsuginis group]MBB3665028.1 3-deoxy-7-phosphoheptulonate synthase [Prauserella sediminis]MCR3718499.1 3-deoxy-D-arabinoheptulosonate-7-phosphate synthase [Prauserella flava]MCR3733069.1 3-deoxy-D-arabinoheptulosonate-7-phosphate synthase [Prauserella salsuginis]
MATLPTTESPDPTAASPAGTRLDDHRITHVSPLMSPALLRQEHPVDDTVARTVTAGREAAVDILSGRDDRLLVVAGPCSVHDPEAALDYARKLAAHAEKVRGELHIVMRVYFEKPRTTLGWKGLINDPDLDGRFAVNKGLRLARQLLLDVSALGLPVGCEFLDPIIPQYIADIVTWGSIGARTAASQVHRQLCSGLSMPVGIKNSTEGDVQVAVDATRAAAGSHVFPGITTDGVSALLTTAGNEDCHVILRGGSAGPNHDSGTVADTLARLRKADLPERVVVDASHGNSGKDHVRQAGVVTELAERIGAGEPGISGLMLESFLADGRQDLTLGRAADLDYGRSITDACLDWTTTASLLDDLAAAVRARRG